MKTLKDGEQVKWAGIKHQFEVTVGTIEGYARKYNEDPQEALDRNEAFIKAEPWTAGERSLAWTHKAAGELVADFPGKAAWIQEKRERFANATVLENGELVEIEGRRYTVRVLARADAVSDPIHFVPVK